MCGIERPARWAYGLFIGRQFPGPKGPGWRNYWPVGPKRLLRNSRHPWALDRPPVTVQSEGRAVHHVRGADTKREDTFVHVLPVHTIEVSSKPAVRNGRPCRRQHTFRKFPRTSCSIPCRIRDMTWRRPGRPFRTACTHLRATVNPLHKVWRRSGTYGGTSSTSARNSVCRPCSIRCLPCMRPRIRCTPSRRWLPPTSAWVYQLRSVGTRCRGSILQTWY